MFYQITVSFCFCFSYKFFNLESGVFLKPLGVQMAFKTLGQRGKNLYFELVHLPLFLKYSSSIGSISSKCLSISLLSLGFIVISSRLLGSSFISFPWASLWARVMLASLCVPGFQDIRINGNRKELVRLVTNWFFFSSDVGWSVHQGWGPPFGKTKLFLFTPCDESQLFFRAVFKHTSSIRRTYLCHLFTWKPKEQFPKRVSVAHTIKLWVSNISPIKKKNKGHVHFDA